MSLEAPESPRSFSSGLSGSPPMLDPSTLSILDSFMSQKLEEEQLFKQIAAQAPPAALAGLSLDTEVDGEENEVPMISVDEFRVAFGEDWQLSQFWSIPRGYAGHSGYTTPFANRLAECIHSLCTSSTTVAFVCCPTAFVAFQHLHPKRNTRLLEFDQRFSVLAPRMFVPYDLDEPESLPDSLKGTVDIAVVDPPFLNERTNKKLAQTLRQILRPNGKLIMVTSKSVEDVLKEVYSEAPLGPLIEAPLHVEHGRLANDFACWGSWDGVEHFGSDLFEE